MPAPVEIVQLVELFQSNYDQYHSPAFSEAAVRLQFIDPFFTALGWDMYNTQGFAEQYKEVVHEDKVKVAGATKAPDYGFRLGPARVFFMEAKKPAVDIQHDVEPAYQLRRYAWSAHLPLSILTDFEQLSVYDCRTKPAITDKASAGRILLLGYKEYVARWDEIAGVFSKAAVQQGALDKFAEAKAGKRGTAEVDDEFLAEIERWRELLARNLALRNGALRGRDLNWAVQQIIDRIVFLRICEARDLETFEQLHALLNGGHTYERLQELFRRADMRYNSGLFHFEQEKDRAEAPDTLTPSLAIDDKVLKDIIEHLYYPQSPYEFSVLPADILGHVYEQFLGKVIRLTPGRVVKIEEKPEVRKAGGVFYTPTYIVDYIVRQTVGPLLEGKAPGPTGGATRLRILDPACGSGSFLLGAYQFLLDWHLTEYLKDPERWLKGKQPALERVSSANGAASGGSYRLAIAERKRILMNNIYGVDIDPQAVEVTKLSLLLKVLEGEGVAGQMSLLPERVLPDLGRNIKCGNSLIGPEFYDNKLDLPDEETVSRVNAFDWKTEFPEAMAAGGFDAVIGNPPYVRQETLGAEFKTHAQRVFKTYHGIADLYVYFIEKGFSLVKDDGKLSYIVANKWMRANYGRPLREWMVEKYIEEIVDFGDLPVFESATTYPCILRISKTVGVKEFDVLSVETLEFPSLPDYVREHKRVTSRDRLDPGGWSLADNTALDALDTIRKAGIPLGDYVDGRVYYGIKTGLNEAFVIDGATRDRLISEDARSAEVIKPFLQGREVKKYGLPIGANYLILFPRGFTNQNCPSKSNAWDWIRKTYPAIANHLLPHEGKAKARYDKGEYWWELRACDYYAEFEKPKIIYPNICKQPEFTFDEEGQYTNQKCFIISTHDPYLLGLLNSSLSFFLFRSLLPRLRGDFFEPSYIYFKDFPIRTINFSDPADVARHDRMVALVTQMLDLHGRLVAEGVPHEKAALQRRIEMTDRQIDALVYELYGLTAEEIKVVEGTTTTTTSSNK